MAEGYLSSQVYYPFLPPAIYPFLLYRITIPAYHEMILSHSQIKDIKNYCKKIIQNWQNITKNVTSIYHQMQYYYHQ